LAVLRLDTPQRHFEDTLRTGRHCVEPQLIAQMFVDGPEIVRWLIPLGMQFDQAGDQPWGDQLMMRPGGTSGARIVSFRDYTGLELMRVLRETTTCIPRIEIMPQSRVVELLTNERGHLEGAPGGGPLQA